MKRLLLIVILLVLATTLVACDLFASSQPTEPPQPPPQQPQPTQPSAPSAPTGQSQPIPPTGACQSRLWCKVANTAGQPAPNAAVEIAGASFKGKAVADASGTYGFAGLCAGEYSVTVTPPNGKPQPVADKARLDGTQMLKMDLSFK